MAGFAVVPEVWIGAGNGVGEIADELADGVDAFCRATGGASRFGSDDLGRALFEGDAGSGAPGFAGLRDGLRKDLAAAVNLLRGMGAGLVDAGGRYVEADGTIVDELGDGRYRVASPGTPTGLGAYRPPEVSGGLPSTVPAPGFVRQAQWFFETVGLGCPWPDGDPLGVAELRDAAVAMERVLDHVIEGVAGHAGRVTGSGSGHATEAFGAAARVVHGEGGLLADLNQRCEQFAAYCQSGIDAIVKSRWQFVASAIFVLTLIYAASVFGPLLEAAVTPLIRLEGLALRIALRMIREAATGAVFSGGLDGIDQLFRGDGFHVGELAGALWQGALAGGLMGFTHTGLSGLAGRSPALTWLAHAMESPGADGVATRFVVGGSVGTAAIATASAVSGHGWDFEHAAETGFGMAFVGTGAEAFSRLDHLFRRTGDQNRLARLPSAEERPSPTGRAAPYGADGKRTGDPTPAEAGHSRLAAAHESTGTDAAPDDFSARAHQPSPAVPTDHPEPYPPVDPVRDQPGSAQNPGRSSIDTAVNPADDRPNVTSRPETPPPSAAEPAHGAVPAGNIGAPHVRTDDVPPVPSHRDGAAALGADSKGGQQPDPLGRRLTMPAGAEVRISLGGPAVVRIVPGQEMPIGRD